MENRVKLTLGETIKTLRKREGMSAKELALRAGLTAAYISRLENDDIPNPSFKTIIDIVNVISDFEVFRSGNENLDIYNEDFIALLLMRIEKSESNISYETKKVSASYKRTSFDELDNDEHDFFIKFFGDYIKYKNDYDSFDKWEYSFLEKLKSILNKISLNDIRNYMNDEDNLLITSLGIALIDDDFINCNSKLRSFRKRINEDLEKIILNRNGINSFDILNFFKRLIRYWFSYFYYKINDSQGFIDDDDYDDNYN